MLENENSFFQKKRSARTAFFISHFPLLFLTIAFVSAIIVGLALRNYEELKDPDLLNKLELPGILYRRCLRALLLPLLVTGIFTSAASDNFNSTVNILHRGFWFAWACKTLSMISAITVAVCFQPGEVRSESGEEILPTGTLPSYYPMDALVDIARNLFPPNIIEATLFHHTTGLYAPNGTYAWNSQTPIKYYFDDPFNMPVKMRKQISEKENYSPNDISDFGDAIHVGTNYAGIALFSLITGLALSKMDGQADFLVELCREIMLIVLGILKASTWVAAIGVFFLTVTNVIILENETLREGLGLFLATVLMAIAIHCLFSLPVLFVITCQETPWRFLCGTMNALIAAFSTTSYLEAIPINLESANRKNGIDLKVACLTLLLLTFVNRNGTVIVDTMAVLYVAQAQHFNLNIPKILFVGIVSMITDVGNDFLKYPVMPVMSVLSLEQGDYVIIRDIVNLMTPFSSACNTFGDAILTGIVFHRSADDIRTKSVLSLDEIQLRSSLESKKKEH